MNTRHGFQIGTVRGIPIRIHYTFLIILPFLAYVFGQNFVGAARLAGLPADRLSGSPWLWGLLVAGALFASVLVHEVAHSLYGLSHGAKVRSITLLMIGGVSEMTEPPKRPSEEAWMALAGPAASLAIGVVFLALSWASKGLASFNVRFALFYLAELNLFVGFFNLLPAFPMDGGRILRGVLVRSQGPVRATQLAATAGKGFAILFAIWGFFTANFILLLIAFFVFVGAEGEQQAVMTRALLGELRVSELMKPPPTSVQPDVTLFEVGERMLREKRLSFPVADAGRVLGTVTYDAVERVPLDQRRQTRARDGMVQAATVAPSESVSDVLRLFSKRRTNSLWVMDEDRLVGMLTRLDVARGLQLRELATSQHPPADARAGSV